MSDEQSYQLKFINSTRASNFKQISFLGESCVLARDGDFPEFELELGNNFFRDSFSTQL